MPNARRAEPARLPETASALIGRRRAYPPGSGGANGAGGGESGPGELPGSRPASLRPAGVRPGLGTVPRPAPRAAARPRTRTFGRGWHLGWAGNRGPCARPVPPPGRYATRVGLVKTGSKPSPPRTPEHPDLGKTGWWSAQPLPPPPHPNRIQALRLLKTGRGSPPRKGLRHPEPIKIGVPYLSPKEPGMPCPVSM